MTDSHTPFTLAELNALDEILTRFKQCQLPQLLAIKMRIDGGDLLSEADVALLTTALQEVQACEHLAEHHVNYRQLLDDVASLYQHITQQALSNLQRAGGN